MWPTSKEQQRTLTQKCSNCSENASVSILRNVKDGWLGRTLITYEKENDPHEPKIVSCLNKLRY